MKYLAYTTDGIDELPIDISAHVSVLQWGKSSALRVNSNEGKAIIRDLFQAHGIHLVYGPQGKEAGMTKLQMRVRPLSNFEIPIVGAIFYFDSFEMKKVSEF